MAGTAVPADRAFLEWLRRYLTDRGVDDPALERALLQAETQRHTHAVPVRLIGLCLRASSGLRAGLQAMLPRPAYLALVRRRRQRSERAVHARLVSLLEGRRA